MNRGDCAKVMRRINAHHGNAPISAEQLEIFREDLDPTITFTEANTAVGEYYRSHTSGCWMSAGDINLMVKADRRKRMPSEDQVNQMVAQLGMVDGDAIWQFRRSLYLACGRGLSVETAVGEAIEAARHPLLAAPSFKAIGRC